MGEGEGKSEGKGKGVRGIASGVTSGVGRGRGKWGEVDEARELRSIADGAGPWRCSLGH